MCHFCIKRDKLYGLHELDSTAYGMLQIFWSLDKELADIMCFITFENVIMTFYFEFIKLKNLQYMYIYIFFSLHDIIV